MKTDTVNNNIIYFNEINIKLSSIINAVNLIANPEIVPINNDLVDLKNCVNMMKKQYITNDIKDLVVYLDKINEAVSSIIDKFIFKNPKNTNNNRKLQITTDKNLQKIYNKLSELQKYLVFKRNELTKENKENEVINNSTSENGEKMSSYESTVSISIKEELLIDVNKSLSAVIGMLNENPLAFYYTKRLYEEFLDSIKVLYEWKPDLLAIMNKVIDDEDSVMKNTDKLKTNDVFKVKVPKYIADCYNVEENVTLYSYIETIVKFLTDIDNRIAGDYTKNHRCIMPFNIAEYREYINVVTCCLKTFLEDNEEEPNSNKCVSIEITDDLESNVEEDLTTLTYLELIERRNLVDKLILKKEKEEINLTVDKIYSLLKDLLDKGIDFDFGELHSKLTLKFQDN